MLTRVEVGPGWCCRRRPPRAPSAPPPRSARRPRAAGLVEGAEVDTPLRPARRLDRVDHARTGREHHNPGSSDLTHDIDHDRRRPPHWPRAPVGTELGPEVGAGVSRPATAVPPRGRGGDRLAGRTAPDRPPGRQREAHGNHQRHDRQLGRGEPDPSAHRVRHAFGQQPSHSRIGRARRVPPGLRQRRSSGCSARVGSPATGGSARGCGCPRRPTAAGPGCASRLARLRSSRASGTVRTAASSALSIDSRRLTASGCGVAERRPGIPRT